MVKAIGSAEGIREMLFETANNNPVGKNDIPIISNYAFHFPAHNAIVSLILYEDFSKEFSNKLLKSAYVCKIDFIDKWNEEAAQQIINIIFPNEKENLWEELVDTKTDFTKIHNFYLFVSIPFGKKTVSLNGDSQIELVEKHLCKAYQETQKNG